MNTDTPRTDNHMEMREEFEGCDPDFTRQLERELNALRALLTNTLESGRKPKNKTSP